MSSYSPDSYRKIIVVSVPIIAAMAGRTLMMFFDRLFLAMHSQLELQAALPAGILSFTLLSIGIGTVGYAGTFIAQYHGAGDREGCSKSLAQGLFLTLFSLPVLAALTIPGSSLLRLAGHAPEILSLEQTYFKILMLSASGPVFTAAASAFWNGRGKTVQVMAAVFAGALLNIVLDYAMIFGRFGFPEMGIEGAAVATAIASFVPGIILTVAAYTGRTARRYKTRENMKFSAALSKRIVRFGFPAGLRIFMDVASFTIFIFIAGRMDTVSFTANNLAFSVNNLAFNPLLGFGFASTIIVATCIGRGDTPMAITAARRTLLLSLAYFVPVALSFVLFPGFYTKLFFSPDSACSIAELNSVTAKLLAILSLWGVFDAISLVYGGALRGAGDTKFVFWATSVASWLFWIPGLFYLYRVRSASLIDLWLFTAFYFMIFSMVLYFRFRAGSWRKIDLLGKSAASSTVN